MLLQVMHAYFLIVTWLLEPYTHFFSHCTRLYLQYTFRFPIQIYVP